VDREIRLAALLLIAVSLAVGWQVSSDMRARIGQAAPGFVLFENGVVGPPFLTPRQAGYGPEGVRISDRITAVDGVPIRDARDVWAAARLAGPGATLRYALVHPDGRPGEARVETDLFRGADYDELLLPLLLGGLLLLLVGSVPVLVRPALASGRILFVFCWATVTNYCFLAFDYFAVYRFMPWGYVVEAVATGAVFHLALSFPKRRWPLTRHPRGALAVIYGLAAAQSAVYAGAVYTSPRVMFALDKVALPGFLVGLILLIGNILHSALRAPDALERQRARVVLAGSGLALCVGAGLVATGFMWLDLGIPTVAYVMLGWTLPLSLAYAMLKHNLFEIDAVVRRGLSTGVLVVTLALAYLGTFAALREIAGGGAAWVSAGVSVALLALLVPAVAPLRRRVERAVETVFFPGHQRAREIIHDTSRALVRRRDPGDLAQLLRRGIAESIRAQFVHVLVGGANETLRELDPASAGEAPVVSPADPLVALLRSGETVHLEEPDTGAEPLARGLRRHLERLGVRLVVPFPPGDAGDGGGAGEVVVGGLLLGPRDDGRLYTSDDVTLLETLAAQSVVAIQNARAWAELRELQRRVAAENLLLRQEMQVSHGFDEIVGDTPGLRAVLAQIEQVAPTHASVLVQGETGTGKELVVRAIHRRSERRDRPLVKVACAAIPETLLESELFGHEKGAFTGAAARKLGRFEVADGGTLFLDDVDTLPLAIQAKLLRALQEGEVQRLGSTELRHVDVRIVAATNKDLLAEIEDGRFREDLFYRLNVVPIRIPPLRERREDIPRLVHHFLAQESAKLGRETRGITEEAMAQIVAHDWPGNVRELRNAVERAIVMSPGDVVRLAGPLGEGRTRSAKAVDPLEGRPLAERVRAFKIELISRTLAQCGGHQRKAAERLGLHPPSLSRMIRELGIAVPGARATARDAAPPPQP